MENIRLNKIKISNGGVKPSNSVMKLAIKSATGRQTSSRFTKGYQCDYVDFHHLSGESYRRPLWRPIKVKGLRRRDY